jgi:hypothetical protein
VVEAIKVIPGTSIIERNKVTNSIESLASSESVATDSCRVFIFELRFLERRHESKLSLISRAMPERFHLFLEELEFKSIEKRIGYSVSKYISTARGYQFDLTPT